MNLTSRLLLDDIALRSGYTNGIYKEYLEKS